MDLIVIGGGPGGCAAAEEAARLGRRVLLVARTHHHSLLLPRGGGLRDESVRRGLEQAGVRVEAGDGHLASAGHVRVGDRLLRAQHVLLAQGAAAKQPRVAGLERASMLDVSYLPRRTMNGERILVLGAERDGLELASFLVGQRAQVTLVAAESALAADWDGEVAAAVRNSLADRGVSIHEQAKVVRGASHRLVVRGLDGAAVELEFEWIVNAGARSARVDEVALRRLGVAAGTGGVRVDARLRTTLEGVWACGDVTGRRGLALAAAEEARVAVRNMFGAPERIRYGLLLAVLRTEPEAASVGWTEAALRAGGVEYERSRLRLPGGGWLKQLTGARRGQILGVHGWGHGCSRWVQDILAQQAGAPAPLPLAGVHFSACR